MPDDVPLTMTRAELAEKLRAARIEGIETAAKWCDDSGDYYTEKSYHWLLQRLERAVLAGEL